MFAEVMIWLENNSLHEKSINNNELSRSVVIDIDDEDNLARLTFWDDNSCMLEVMDVNTGNYILNERHDISHVNEFVALYKKFESALN
jgi:hypothetical protein